MLRSRCVFSITLAASATRSSWRSACPADTIDGVQAVDVARRLRRRAGGDLQDVVELVRAVAGLMRSGAVADEEVLVELQAGRRARGSARHTSSVAARGTRWTRTRPRRRALSTRRWSRLAERSGRRSGAVGGVDRGRHGDDVGCCRRAGSSSSPLRRRRAAGGELLGRDLAGAHRGPRRSASRAAR
jgi:hypothetical protein